MLFSKPKFFTSFAALNVTQFLAAFNDNFYKLLLIFFLIATKGEEHSNTILALAGAIFVIPFLLFASLSGTLADRFSKRSIIYFTRLLEILTTSMALFAFVFESAIAGYTVLFLMATHSALFSPCKFGIIPEIVSKEKISGYNGIITASTYLAIILGTFGASFLTDITGRNFVLGGIFCVGVSALGLLAALGIQKTKPQAADTKVSVRMVSTIIEALVRARKRRYLLHALVFGAYFLFLGAYTQLNIIPFTLQSLHLSDVQGGYLFLMTAIGIGIGSFTVGRLSGGDVELGFVPLAALGVTLCFILLFLFSSHLFVVVPLLMFVGFFGGFFVVPIDTFIQVASPKEHRGQNLAAANFLSFVGVIVASLLIAFFGSLLGLQARTGFLLVGLLSGVIGVSLLLLFADQVLRLLVANFSKRYLDLHVAGRKRVRSENPVLLIAQRRSWIDTFLVMATLPRLIRYIVPTKPKRRLFYKFLRFIPLDIEHYSPIGKQALEAIKSELAEGQTVCLMHPVDFHSKKLEEWEEALKKEIEVPIVPVRIERPSARQMGRRAQLKSLRGHRIRIVYGASPYLRSNPS